MTSLYSTHGTSKCSQYGTPANYPAKKFVGGAVNNLPSNSNQSYQQVASKYCCPATYSETSETTTYIYNWAGVFANCNYSGTATTTPQTFFATVAALPPGPPGSTGTTEPTTSDETALPLGLYKGSFKSGIPSLQYVSSLNINNNDSSSISFPSTTTVASNSGATIVVVGVPGVGVYVSTNSTASWSRTYATTDDTILVASNSDGSVLMAAISNVNASPPETDIYISSDSGTSWKKEISISSYILSIAMDSSSNVVLSYYIGTSGTSGIYTWTVGDSNVSEILMNPNPNGYQSKVTIVTDSTTGSTIITGTADYSFYVGNADGLTATTNVPTPEPSYALFISAATNNTGANIGVLGMYNTPSLYPGVYNSASNNYNFSTPKTSNQSQGNNSTTPLASDNYGNLYTVSNQILTQLQLDPDTNTYTSSQTVTFANITDI